MTRPDTQRALASLKDFQRDTVDYVFHRMYEQAEPTTRFLVADEVGNVAAFLLSDLAGGISAEITYVDGGFSHVVGGMAEGLAG